MRHQPGECARAHTFAAVRRRETGEMFYRYAFVLTQAGEIKEPKAIFQRHQLKGAKEQGFSEVLSDLDLHHPPCLELIANQAFYAIATLAYNILAAGIAGGGAELAGAHDHSAPADGPGDSEPACAL